MKSGIKSVNPMMKSTNNTATMADNGGDNDSGMCNKRTLVIAGTVLGVVLVIAVLAFLIPLTSRKSCKLLINTKPNSTMGKTVASGDKRALAEFDGYYRVNKTAIVPLELQSIDMSGYTLSLFFDCATVSLKFALSNKDIIIAKSNLTLTFLDKNPKLFVPQCDNVELSTPFDPSSQAYDCQSEQNFDCKTTNSSDASKKVIVHGVLTINKLTFEINGERKKHEKGEFSFKKTSSCPTILREADKDQVVVVEPVKVIDNQKQKSRKDFEVPDEVVSVDSTTDV